MSLTSMTQALEFVSRLELPAGPSPALEAAAEETPAFDFSAAKNQAMVVGSDIVSFTKGVTPERRSDIVRSSLLAQLVAKKQVPAASDVYRWYEAYFEVLINIGWVIQDRSFSTYSEVSDNFEAHKAILKVATALLGPTAAALVVVQATLDALQSMPENSPWITLFNRQSQSAKSAKFQVTLAEQAENGEFLVSLMAFGLTATSTLTQVLFFKFRSSDVSLKHFSGKVTIDSEVLHGVREAISQKIDKFVKSYVEALPDL
jgi:hypothetical protein